MKSQFIIIGVLICLVSGCKNQVSNNKATFIENDTLTSPNESKVMKTKEQTPYFISSGTEPFWSLEIFSNLIVFKTPTDSLKTPHIDPIIAMDANVKLYKVETESSQITIQIIQNECVNDMSGEVSPYKVSIKMKKTTEKDFENLEGCGKYITDYRLHDIWVLDSLNGKKITNNTFSKELPNIEINSSQNTFMGYSGCNQMNGTLFFEKDLLRFTNIVSTKKMCESSNQETEFLKALQNSIRYSIENNRLTLFNSSKTLIVFRKVD